MCIFDLIQLIESFDDWSARAPIIVVVIKIFRYTFWIITFIICRLVVDHFTL